MNKRLRAAVAVPLLAAAVLTGTASESSAATGSARPGLEPVAKVIYRTAVSPRSGYAGLSATSITLPARRAA